MLLCHECGSDVAEHDIFCPYCGISLQRAEAPVPIEMISDANPVDVEMDSTLMMTPEEARKLANDVIAASVELPPSDGVATDPSNTESTVGFKPDSAEEALSLEVPTPAILNAPPNTSGNVELRATAEYAAVESVEFSYDEIPVVEQDDEVGEQALEVEASNAIREPDPFDEAGMAPEEDWVEKYLERSDPSKPVRDR